MRNWSLSGRLVIVSICNLIIIIIITSRSQPLYINELCKSYGKTKEKGKACDLHGRERTHVDGTDVVAHVN